MEQGAAYAGVTGAAAGRVRPCSPGSRHTSGSSQGQAKPACGDAQPHTQEGQAGHSLHRYFYTAPFCKLVNMHIPGGSGNSELELLTDCVMWHWGGRRSHGGHKPVVPAGFQAGAHAERIPHPQEPYHAPRAAGPRVPSALAQQVPPLARLDSPGIPLQGVHSQARDPPRWRRCRPRPAPVPSPGCCTLAGGSCWPGGRLPTQASGCRGSGAPEAVAHRLRRPEVLS